MEAMNYEYLIRAVFKCGRTRRFGADADIFLWIRKSICTISWSEVG